MPKKSFDDQTADVAALSNAQDRMRGKAKLRAKVLPKKPMGAPSLYSEKMATTICKMIENGKTLTAITKELNLSLDCVYGWLKRYPAFAESYQSARESMARSLADELIDDMKEATPDKALLMKVKASVYQWAIARFNPKEFSDSKRLEISAQIDHKHVHELSVDQRKRIAESWLMSQSDNAPLIEAITTGPDLPVEIVADKVEREIPRKVKAPQQQKKKQVDDNKW